MSTDRPTYDGAAYAVDRARTHAAAGEWEPVGDRAVAALDQVSDAPYPHLVDRLHEQATDVVLTCKRESVDRSRVDERLEEMQSTLAAMQSLALSETTMFTEEFGE